MKSRVRDLKSEAMEALKAFGKRLGLSEDEISQGLQLQRPPLESVWIENALNLNLCFQLMEAGRLMEYDCYDDHGDPQGTAYLELVSWEDKTEGLFVAKHMGATDGYYAWYGSNELKEGACLYHMCLGRAPRCKTRLPRGDRRILIHVDRWRMLTPENMVVVPYLKEAGVRLGEQALEAMAHEKEKRNSHDKGAAGLSGLDAALRDAGIPPLPPGRDDKGRREEKKKRDRSPRSRSREKGKSGVGRYLRDQAEAREKRREEEKHSRRGRSERKEKKTRRDKKKKLGERSSSSDGEDLSSDESMAVFREAPARGGDLVQIAREKPGHLLRQGLLEMGKFLAEREDAFEEKERWRGRKVMSYISQVMLNKHPLSKIGLRSYREVLSIGGALDHLLQGQLAECGDLLMQRLKALETSFQEGGWSSAKHQELRPAVDASITGQHEKEAVAKMELRAIKLRQALQRANK